ncbi:MAG TPA: TlpA disulfide reductase family protein [Kofleriaceae bacterium]|nr:TlpA disulfide reductase family protein [Kofleriaceae bacterium]
MADAPKSSARSAPPRADVVKPRGVVVDPKVLLAGGAVAVIGLAVLAFFLWMVPNAAAREARAACNGLKATGPAMCDGQPCQLPMEMPNFTAYDHTGKPVDFKQKYRGKVVLLNFWASWCGVCKTEKPKLYQMAQEMSGGDFVVVALASDRTWTDVLLAIVESLAPQTKLPDGEVSLDQAKQIYGNAMPKGLPFDVLLDPPEGDNNIGQIAASWGIKAVPESALIDRNGQIRAYFVNKRDWESPVAETCLRSVIDE